MAPRSKFSMLPQDLRNKLIDRLIESNFSDITGHHQWLLEECESRDIEFERGPISRAAIGRVSQAQQGIAERMQEVRRVEREFSSDPVRTGKSTNNMLQVLAFIKTRDAMNGMVEVDIDELNRMALTNMRLEKAAALNEDREREIRDDERQLAREAAAEKAGESAAQAGVSAETVERIRRDVLGMG